LAILEELWVSQEGVYLSCELSPRVGVPLLERGGALQEEASYLLRGGTPLTHSLLPCVDLMEDEEKWQPHLSQLAKLFSPSGTPSLLGKCTAVPFYTSIHPLA